MGAFLGELRTRAVNAESCRINLKHSFSDGLFGKQAAEKSKQHISSPGTWSSLVAWLRGQAG